MGPGRKCTLKREIDIKSSNMKQRYVIEVIKRVNRKTSMNKKIILRTESGRIWR